MNLLPREIYKYILSYLNIKDVLNYCLHSKITYDISNEYLFWEDYLNIKYEFDSIKEIVSEFNQSLTNIEFFDVLSKIAPTANELKVSLTNNVRYAVYIESIKIITLTERYNGFPCRSKIFGISPYDPIWYFIQNTHDGVERWLYGDDIVFYLNDEDNLVVKGLKNQTFKLKIMNNISNILDIKVKDVIINELPLIDYITTSEFNRNNM